MSNKFRYGIGKKLAQLSFSLLKYLPTGGKSFPGLFFINFSGRNTIRDLSEDQTEIGSILITGTNGKTTTTTMLIELLSEDLKLSTSVGNNTIYSLTTGLLHNKSQLGVFEYGIRDIEHGTPDEVCRLVNPIGVIYTNISREHTQVAGIKNPFEKYVKAKTLLSQCMKDGILITNADDPYTTFIGQNKEEDNHVIYYGLELENYENIFEDNPVKCPKCKKTLEYTKHYINQRGVYHCSCGFKRPEPDVKVTHLKQEENKYGLTIEFNEYNYHKKDKIQSTIELEIPSNGIHNIYNTLTTIAVYVAFTPNDNIKETVERFFNNYQFTVPPGRFEILKKGDKTIGVGQGDNGDALKINSQLMNDNIDGKLEFIYTTPDAKEEEIFEDHHQSIKALKPDKLVVIPGRTSTTASEEYFNQIKEEYNCEYYPVDFDFEQRINKVMELIKKSEYDNIIVSGCGEEIVFWEALKNRIKNSEI